MVIKMLTGLARRMEDFNKEIGNIKKNQSDRKNTINKMKNILQGINSSLENCLISDLEDKVIKSPQAAQQKEKKKLG